MAVKLALLILSLLYRDTHSETVYSKCKIKFRTLNGSCSNALNPGWGLAGQTVGSGLISGYPSSPLPSSMLADHPERIEPVTEWLGAWTVFIKHDLLDIRELKDEFINLETPLLDLSNMYGTSGNKIQIVSEQNDETWEVGEKILWRLLEAEESRLVAELRRRNQDWGLTRVKQESRRILIGEYNNIIVKELAPLLLGYPASFLQQVEEDVAPEPISVEELLVGVQAHLALGATEIISSQPNLKSIWMKLGERMLTLRQQVPSGGVTMDRLNDVSEALDLVERIGMLNWRDVRTKCKLQEGQDYYEALFRGGKDGSLINPLLGGLAENPGWGSILSPTLACLLNKLLSKVINGDSFWYTRDKKTGRMHEDGLRKDQIESLKSVTLSSLLCENIPNIRTIQPSSFLLPDESLNNQISCLYIPRLDLSLWESEEPGLDLEEEEEIEQALRVAMENLLKFRKLEYNLLDSSSLPVHSSLRAQGAVSKPSIQVQNTVNNSALFEFVTYEFMKSPRLANLVASSTSQTRSRREAKTAGIDFNDPQNSIDINGILNSKVKEKLESLPTGHNFYTTVTVENVPSSPRFTARVLPAEATQVVTLGKCFPSEDLTPCNSEDKYRTYSGWCNNVNNPEWGKSNSPHRRFLPSEYEDGVSTPRQKSVRGSSIPNPRTVSQDIHTNEAAPDPKYTLMLMQWGQFIDHDMTHTPMVRGHGNSILECKSCDSGVQHPACNPIKIPQDDPFFTYNRVDPKCIPFTRSFSGQQKIGPREQLNQISSYIDASALYGSDECQTKQLRKQDSYLLKTFSHPLNRRGGKYKYLLPRTTENLECFSPTGECFLAGDGRVNEHPGLTVMHTLLVREHNSIAEKLAALNPHWDNEKVFQETRRILGAQVQHITYNEFLPRVLGLNSLKVFDIDLRTGEYYNDYDPECSATTFNEFATAAFRFGHSTIRPNLTVMSEQALLGRSSPRDLQLRNHFNNPDVIMEEHMVDDLLRGLVMTPMETVDNRMTEEISNHLFEERGKTKSGMDLIALNIQRGRDHGIPGYNKYREMCKLKRAKNFLDFQDEIPLDIINKMQKIYKHPDDVDLFPGLLSERKLAGALTGPTLTCLIGLQFSHLRKCDRFWYETGNHVLKFSEDQLTELRRTSLAGLICRNMDDNSLLPRSAMDQMDRLTNPMVDCAETIKHLDLEAWKEKGPVDKTCEVSDQTIRDGETHRASPCTECTCTTEGLKCETINLFQSGSSCLALVNKYGIKQVEEDETCRSQCRIL